MSWSSSLQGEVTSTVSPSESLRFARSVTRVELGMGWRDFFDSPEEACTELMANVRRADSDLTIVRLPSEIVSMSAHLVASRRLFLAAGTLIYWQRSLVGSSGSPTEIGAYSWTADTLPEEKLTQLVATVPRIFGGYSNHYSYNDSLPRESVEAGYKEWATSTLRSSNGFVSAIEDETGVSAVASGRFADSSRHVVEIELAGVVAEARRRGVYSRLVAEAMRFAASEGAVQIVISTQAANTAVQAAWAKQGFLPSHSIDTFHLMKEPAS